MELSLTSVSLPALQPSMSFSTLTFFTPGYIEERGQCREDCLKALEGRLGATGVTGLLQRQDVGPIVVVELVNGADVCVEAGNIGTGDARGFV